MSLERFRVPDLSIGATVLIVAIALPFFVFTRMEHLHRVQAKASAPPSATPYQAAISTPDPTTTPADPPSTTSLPSTGPSSTPKAKTSTGARAGAKPTSTPTVATTATVAPMLDDPPVAVLTVTPTAGTAPLAVIASPAGSTDVDGTPIQQIIVDFGDGSQCFLTTAYEVCPAHSYSAGGSYTVTERVIDTAKNFTRAADVVVTVT